MSPNFCEKEQTVTAALHAGALDSELLAHTVVCPICSEILLVGNLLREEGSNLEDDLHLPEAIVVWRKAQSRAAEQALAKATLPIRIVRLSTIALGFAALPWIAVELARHSSWLPDLGMTPPSLFSGPSAAALGETTLMIATAMLILAGVSSWYLLREE